MLFCAAHVTASIDGEYFQILARSQDTAANLEIPYLIIQRQLEDPDGGVFYVESHDENDIGHFRLRKLELSLSRMLSEIFKARVDDR